MLHKVIQNFKKTLSIKSFGNSMYPILQSGDIVHIKKVAFKLIREDDIICFKSKGSLLTHRVIFVEKNYVICKGDNNTYADGKIYRKQILGVVNNLTRSGIKYNINDIYLLQSSVYFDEIVKVISLFEKNKIEYLFLKGLPLQLFYKKSHPKRIYADCDVLIDEKYFTKVSRIFIKRGYNFIDPSLSDIQKGLRIKKTEVGYVKLIGQAYVYWDVHFEVKFTFSHLKSLNKLYPETKIIKLSKQFIREKRIVNMHGVNFPILSTENLIVYLMLHLFRHNYHEIHRFAFLRLVLKSKKIDYLKIADIIQRYHLVNFVYPCFLILERLYGFKISQNFRDSIKPKIYLVYFINKIVINFDIFSSESRIEEGSVRFRNYFILAPSSMLTKLSTLFDKKIILSISKVAINIVWNMITYKTTYLRSLFSQVS